MFFKSINEKFTSQRLFTHILRLKETILGSNREIADKTCTFKRNVLSVIRDCLYTTWRKGGLLPFVNWSKLATNGHVKVHRLFLFGAKTAKCQKNFGMRYIEFLKVPNCWSSQVTRGGTPFWPKS
jgi:hypothetical protein